MAKKKTNERKVFIIVAVLIIVIFLLISNSSARELEINARMYDAKGNLIETENILSRGGISLQAITELPAINNISAEVAEIHAETASLGFEITIVNNGNKGLWMYCEITKSSAGFSMTVIEPVPIEEGGLFLRAGESYTFYIDGDDRINIDDLPLSSEEWVRLRIIGRTTDDLNAEHGQELYNTYTWRFTKKYVRGVAQVLIKFGDTITLGGDLEYDVVNLTSTTINIDPNIGYLNITANTIYIDANSVIEGAGAGFAGGSSASGGGSGQYGMSSGNTGSGPGKGYKGYGIRDPMSWECSSTQPVCVDGGGGAGYADLGLNGQDNVLISSWGNPRGGSAYATNDNFNFVKGSGGASGGIAYKSATARSGKGGGGGGAVLLTAGSIILRGSIDVDGARGGEGVVSGVAAAGGGGGGSGGTIILNSPNIDISDAYLSVKGGKSGRGNGYTSGDGGVASGGRIKIFCDALSGLQDAQIYLSNTDGNDGTLYVSC